MCAVAVAVVVASFVCVFLIPLPHATCQPAVGLVASQSGLELKFRSLARMHKFRFRFRFRPLAVCVRPTLADTCRPSR